MPYIIDTTEIKIVSTGIAMSGGSTLIKFEGILAILYPLCNTLNSYLIVQGKMVLKSMMTGHRIV